MTEAMIDIETFDTANSAVIFQIGVVVFNGATIITKRCIDILVQPQISSIDGRTISASTLAFWLNPEISGVAHAALTNAAATTLTGALTELKGVLDFHNPEQVWAKGSFDFNLLEDACDQHSCAVPWNFRQPRDLRTMMKECGVPKHDNISHNALDDCYHQHKQLMECRALISKWHLPIADAGAAYHAHRKDGDTSGQG
jgi:hypothetical protein